MQKIIEKLDLKDRKILYHLDLDSRQSFAQIDKKIGLHKVVALRVKKLQEKGIIKNFFTLIDTSKLGYTYIRIYLVYERFFLKNYSNTQKIIKYLDNKSSLFCIDKTTG